MKWREITLLLASLLICPTAEAQGPIDPATSTSVGWVQPYSVMYWEHIAQSNRSAEVLYVDSFATVKETVERGDRIALVGELVSVFENGNHVGNEAVVSSEIRYVGNDASGFTIEVREPRGGFTALFSECRDKVFVDFWYILAVKWLAIDFCAPKITWGEWRPLRFPSHAVYTSTKKPRLALDLTAVGDQLFVMVIP